MDFLLIIPPVIQAFENNPFYSSQFKDLEKSKGITLKQNASQKSHTVLASCMLKIV
jgi:hypothetical protein